MPQNTPVCTNNPSKTELLVVHNVVPVMRKCIANFQFMLLTRLHADFTSNPPLAKSGFCRTRTSLCTNRRVLEKAMDVHKGVAEVQQFAQS